MANLRQWFREIVPYNTRENLRDFANKVGVQNNYQGKKTYDMGYQPTAQETGITTYQPYAPKGDPMQEQTQEQGFGGGNNNLGGLQTGGTPRTSVAAGAGASGFMMNYRGKQYTDYTDYVNAVRTRAKEVYDQTIKGIEDAYNAGLLDLSERDRAIQENREAIKKQQQDALADYENAIQANQRGERESMQDISGYFSANSPFAYQSAQAGLEGQVKDTSAQNQQLITRGNQRNQESIQQALSSLDTQAADTNRARRDFESGRRTQIDAARIDYEAGNDEINNEALDYANSTGMRPPAPQRIQAQTQRLNPQQIAQSYTGFYNELRRLGYSQQQAQSVTADRLRTDAPDLGLNPQDIEPLLATLYGQFVG